MEKKSLLAPKIAFLRLIAHAKKSCVEMESFLFYGEENLPKNRMLLVILCMIRKRKGWSATN